MIKQKAAAEGRSTRISTKKTSADWEAIKPALRINTSPAAWKPVLADFFWDRLNSRYMQPIEAIRENGKLAGEGFAIVAIQCSLVEFLESCYQGKNYVHGRKAAVHEYTDSRGMFLDFLTKREPFSTRFDQALASDFYRSVRCGVLHEARTKGGWLIHGSSGSSLIVNPTKPILYRDDFQQALLEFIEHYRQEVLNSPVLQTAFIRKFDHLAN